jgi:hypothetical protein
MFVGLALFIIPIYSHEWICYFVFCAVLSRVSLKLHPNPWLTPLGFDYILAPPLRVLISQERSAASGLP